MIQALYTASSGMIAQQKHMDVIAHNISNMSTPGYRNKRVEFKELLYRNIQNVDVNNKDKNLLLGNGVYISATTSEPFLADEEMLSFAVNDRSYFCVEDNEGEIFYTKNGDFTIRFERTDAYLVDGEGYYVLDENNERIRLEGMIDSVSTSPDGTIIIGDNMERKVKLGIYSFDNPEGLMMLKANVYSETFDSGEAQLNDSPEFMQVFSEEMNMNFVNDTIKIVQAQMAYEINSRVLNTVDEMERVANSLRG